jgi:hypothetical protein
MTENPLHARILLHDSEMLGHLEVDADAYLAFEKRIHRDLQVLECRWSHMGSRQQSWSGRRPGRGEGIAPPETMSD